MHIQKLSSYLRWLFYEIDESVLPEIFRDHILMWPYISTEEGEEGGGEVDAMGTSAVNTLPSHLTL